MKYENLYEISHLVNQVKELEKGLSILERHRIRIVVENPRCPKEALDYVELPYEMENDIANLIKKRIEVLKLKMEQL